MTDFKHYTIIANLFRYPTEKLLDDALETISVLSGKYPEQAEVVKSFIENFSPLTLHQKQEYYIKTFDIQAVCFLDIGYVLFGEDYKRGDFLVQMKQEQREAQNDCGVELSDHLPNVLTLLSKTREKFAEELIATICIPALDEMINKFNMQNAYLDTSNKHDHQCPNIFFFHKHSVSGDRWAHIVICLVDVSRYGVCISGYQLVAYPDPLCIRIRIW